MGIDDEKPSRGGARVGAGRPKGRKNRIPPPPQKIFSVRLHPDVLSKLRTIARLKGVVINSLAEKILKEGLEQEERMLRDEKKATVEAR